MHSRGEPFLLTPNSNRQDSLMLDGPESVLPLTHPRKEYVYAESTQLEAST
jgi:hypothetical protein